MAGTVGKFTLKVIICAIFAAWSIIPVKAAEENNPLANVFPDSIRVIALVAPGLPAAKSEPVDRAVNYLRQAGKKVKVMPNARRGEPCCNYKDNVEGKLRIADIEQAWLDPEVDLILCVRGGSGTAGIVEHLNWEKLRTRPDMRVQGFSDITCLHLAMLKEKAGHPVCGPSLTNLLRVDKASLESINLGLSGQPRKDINLEVIKDGQQAVSGVILAGHLSLLDVMNRTKYKADTANRVIFMECPNLDAKRAAAALERLRKSGFFDHCAAVVFGRFPKCRKAEKSVKKEFADKVKCPVFDKFPYSHGKANHLLDLRKSVEISPTGVLKFL